ncbi:MAG: hypothetical protein K9N47_20435 [Prosthecobacter sp.]|uniref:hypothetical protein n=1 Tax=Prosthecobacter sp. TaxID=1965333 RepID=UPI0026346925|nr:hypothetical protein [Prosthecobacter sp.]MCF7788501.1 hypothetical protein [Prosthecobacter sp.]
MTRPEFASFVRRFASGATDAHEWDHFAIQHYADIVTEQARVRLVRLLHRHELHSPVGIENELEQIASVLLLPVSPASFYYMGGAAGILREPLPISTSSVIIAYEPYRSRAHRDMHEALLSGDQPICEYMYDDRRHSFTVIDAPEYGRLSIHV